MPHLLLLLLLLFLQIHDTASFAAWMVERAASCWTDLTPGEIVMNFEILSHTQSRHPDIHLVARSSDDVELQTPLAGQSALPFNNGDEIILSLDYSSAPAAAIGGLQYLVQIGDQGGGVFTGGGPVGCDGRRVAGRKKEDRVRLRLDGSADTVTIWAGWATEHEAVTLTPEMVFQKTSSGKGGGSVTEKEEVEVEGLMGKETTQQKDSKEEHEQIKKRIAMERHEAMKREAHHLHDLEHIEQMQIGVAVPPRVQDAVKQLDSSTEPEKRQRRPHMQGEAMKRHAHHLGSSLRRGQHGGAGSYLLGASIVTVESVYGFVFFGVFIVVALMKSVSAPEGKAKFSL